MVYSIFNRTPTNSLLNPLITPINECPFSIRRVFRLYSLLFQYSLISSPLLIHLNLPSSVAFPYLVHRSPLKRELSLKTTLISHCSFHSMLLKRPYARSSQKLKKNLRVLFSTQKVHFCFCKAYKSCSGERRDSKASELFYERI